VQLTLGATGPLTPYLTDTTFLFERQDALGNLQNVPYVGDVENSTGGNLTLGGSFRNLEINIGFHTVPWQGSILRYEGNGEARRVSEFHIDDAGVDYHRLDPEQRVPDAQVSTSAFSFSTADAAYRYYLKEEGFFEAYVPIGGGLIWAGEPMECKLSFACGIHVFAGIAADLAIEPIAFVFDVRIHGLVTSNAIGVQEAADNATITDSNVLEAFTSTMLFVTFDVGLRYSVY